MGISTYLKGLRDRIGQELILSPGVAAFVRDRHGRILLERRSDDGRWGLPSGAIDPGEAPAQAIAREVWEETGLRVRPVRVVGVFGGEPGFRVTYPNGDRSEYTVIVFECAVLGGTLETRDGESQELRYFPTDDLPENMTPASRRICRASGSAGEAEFLWREEWGEEQ